MTTRISNLMGSTGLKCLIVLAFVICLLPVGAMAIIYVDSPMVIEQPGEYQLVKDITDYDGVRWQNGTDFYEPCIKILASDVIFDGDGHTISAGDKFNQSRDDQVGIYVDAGLERVSVIDTHVDNFNYGIYYYGVNQFAEPEMGGRIDNNKVSDNDWGITLDSSQQVSVLNNDASGTREIGVNLYSSDGNIVRNNIANTNGHRGISLFGSNNNVIGDNSANNNIDAGILLAFSQNNTVQMNMANNNINSTTSGSTSIGDGIYLTQSSGNHIINNTASGNYVAGIRIYPPEQGLLPSWVENNSVSENGHEEGSTAVSWGIYVDTDHGTTHVNNNHAFNHIGYGIELRLDDGSNSGGNLVENNAVGILLHGSKDNVLHGNDVNHNTKYGIELSTELDDSLQYISSDNNILSNNKINNNLISGVYLNGTDNFEPVINNRLTGNDIYNNGEWGVHLYHANLNTLIDNVIRANGILGIKLDGSAYNIIYNNIFNNTINAGFGQMSNNPNTWNVLQEPGQNVVGGPYKGGNYWAQPNGQGWSQINPDTKGNGFCDNEFVIGPDNIDNFPLTNYLKVSFTADKTSGDAPLTVNFAGTVQNQTVTQWLWNFGDGNTADTQNPTHVYQNNGVYTVSLTASNGGWSNTTTKNGFITVGIATPVADFSGTPVTGSFPLTVTFTDLSAPSSGQYAITAWDWDFGDNTPHSNVKSPVHVYQAAGNYDVTLTVTNSGSSNTTSKLSYITSGSTPAAMAAFTMTPGSGPSPLTVQFIDQSSGSPPLTYSWDFGDNSPVSVLQNPEHIYTSEKIYTVNLTVNNAGGQSVVSHDVIVGGPVEPTVAFTAIPRSGTVPLMVSFLDQSTANPDITTYEWDFGDGATSNMRNPAHQYTTSRSYDVTLTVTVNGIAYPITEENFIVVNPPGTVTADFFAVPPSGGIEPVVVQFYDQSSGNPAPTSWFWSFDDQYAQASEKTSTLQSPVHTYLKAGNYTPILTTSNSQGPNTKVYSGVIYVRHIPPVANFSASPTTGYAPFSVTFTDQSDGQALLAWDWNFGDGGTSITKSPVYTYNTPGIYSVTFKSYNDGGWSAPITKTNLITVLASPPSPPANIIKLYPGWNFVSTPKKLAAGENTVDVVFGNVDMDHHSPLLYDGQTKTWIQFISGTVKPLDGIWVYSKYQTDVTLQFDTSSIPLPPSKQVYSGWNAIGETGVNAISARELLTQVGQLNGNWDTLIGINASSHVSETYIRGSINPEYSDLKFTYPTKGYWLQMNTDDTLEGLV
jgi:parallel beta-helix repeat protein